MTDLGDQKCAILGVKEDLDVICYKYLLDVIHMTGLDTRQKYYFIFHDFFFFCISACKSREA